MAEASAAKSCRFLADLYKGHSAMNTEAFPAEKYMFVQFPKDTSDAMASNQIAIRAIRAISYGNLIT